MWAKGGAGALPPPQPLSLPASLHGLQEDAPQPRPAPVPLPQPPLGGPRCWQAVHAQRWGWNHPWAPRPGDLGSGAEISLHNCMSHYFTLLPWLCKFSVCRTSEWTTGAATAGMELALAAVGNIGVGPGLGLNLPHSSHRRSKCITTVVLKLDFSASVLLASWKQCLRDTRANCRHSSGWAGAEGSATLWAHRVMKGDAAEHAHWWMAWQRPTQGFLLLGSMPNLPAYHYSSEMHLKRLLQATVCQ